MALTEKKTFTLVVSEHDYATHKLSLSSSSDEWTLLWVGVNFGGHFVRVCWQTLHNWQHLTARALISGRVLVSMHVLLHTMLPLSFYCFFYERSHNSFLRQSRRAFIKPHSLLLVIITCARSLLMSSRISALSIQKARTMSAVFPQPTLMTFSTPSPNSIVRSRVVIWSHCVLNWV